jgi:hypothetical protein
MGNDDKKSAEQPFLSRWSQRKQQAREEPPATQPAVDAAAPVPVLPPVDTLTMESDFSGFLHPKVDADLRRAALKKLFSDPHFNVMDGLDTYIDDYSQPNPLPAGMLAGLRQAQNILAWAQETREETAARFAPPPVETAVSLPTGQSALPGSETAQLPSTEHATEVKRPATAPVADVTPAAIKAAAAERKS